jgi:hypothetical protein
MDSKQLKGVYQLKQDTYDQMVNEGTTDSSLYFVRDFDGNGKPTSSSIYLGDRKYGEMCNDTIEGNDVEGYDGYSRYVIIEDLKEITETGIPFIVGKKLNALNIAIYPSCDARSTVVPIMLTMEDENTVICNDIYSLSFLGTAIKRESDGKFMRNETISSSSHGIVFKEEYWEIKISENKETVGVDKYNKYYIQYLSYSSIFNKFYGTDYKYSYKNDNCYTFYKKQDM